MIVKGSLLLVGLCLLIANCSGNKSEEIDRYIEEARKAIFEQPIHPHEQKRRFTAKQLSMQFELIKQVFNNPQEPGLSDKAVEDLKPLSEAAEEPICLETLSNLQSATDVIRTALIDDMERSFADHMKMTDPKRWNALINFYYASADALKHWNVSNESLINIVETYRRFENDELTNDEFKQSLMRILNDELLADEEAFKRGDIAQFLNNSEIVDDTE